MKTAKLFLIGVVLTGCDPGFHYTPTGWEPVSYFEWRLQSPGLRIQMLEPGGLIGSEQLVPEFTATNLSTEPLVFETVSLSSKGVSYTGHYSGHPDPQWRTVAPQASKRIAPFISLGRPLFEALGTEVTLDLSYRFGTRPSESLRIQFRRSAE